MVCGCRKIHFHGVLFAICLTASAEELGIALPDEEIDASQPGADGEADSLLRNAVRLVQKADFNAAIRTYQEFLKKHIEHPKAAWVTVRIVELERLAAVQAKERELKRNVSESKPGTFEQAEARARLAEYYAAQDRLKEARQVYRELSEQNPATLQGLEAQLRIAALLEREEDFQAALEAYDAALKTYPERLKAFLEEFPDAGRGPASTGYFANRARLGKNERRQSVLKKIAALYEKLGDQKRAQLARGQLAASLPSTQGSEAHFLTAAEGARLAGRPSAALYLAALKPPRAAPARARALISPNT